MFHLCVFAILMVSCIIGNVCPHQETHTVNTKIGDIIGQTYETAFGNSKYVGREYLGIPYAEAPIGERRFRKPAPKLPLKNPLNATYERPFCPQGGLQLVPLKPDSVSEDCLTLNVFAPEDMRDRANKMFAVMIWIHGGGFITGSADFYVSDVLSTTGDVIVVTINYRLSIFGFLSTGDDACPGNNGLWDQRLAIQWVHENIEAFGGDKDRITLFGQSTGSSSCIYQTLYAGNQGLFKRLIAESGSPLELGTKSFKGKQQPNAVVIGSVMGCADVSSSAVVECLRVKSVAEIMSNLSSVFYRIPFLPVVDGDFLLSDPHEMLNPQNSRFSKQQKLFSSVELLIGANDMEGAMYMMYLWTPVLFVLNRDDFYISRKKYVKKMLPIMTKQIYGEKVPDIVTESIITRYTDLKDFEDGHKIRDLFLSFCSDYISVMPSLYTAIKHSTLNVDSSLFLYKFVAKTSLTIGPIESPKWVTGANQGDETPFVFGFSRRFLSALNVNQTFRPTDDELELSRHMMKFWTNFAKSGNPNAPIVMDNVTNWPKYDNKSSSYFEFSFNFSDPIKQGFGEPTANFWMEFMPAILDLVSHSSHAGDECSTNATLKGKVLSMNVHMCENVVIALAVLSAITVVIIVVTCFKARCFKGKERGYGSIEMVN